MNYKEADLPDDTYKMLRKYFGDYHKDGRPKPPGYRGPKPNEIKPVITGKKMKTFKEFMEKYMGPAVNPKQYDPEGTIIRTMDVKLDSINKFRKGTKFNIPIPLVKKKGSSKLKTA